MQETLFTSQGLLICIATKDFDSLFYSKADTFIAMCLDSIYITWPINKHLNWCSDVDLKIMISEDGKSHAFIICSFGSLENRLILGMHSWLMHSLFAFLDYMYNKDQGGQGIW
mgnify:CR=1 FL=1